MEKQLLETSNAFEMTCYRKQKIAWTEYRTNESIREELKVEDQWLEIFVMKQKLKYFGHLKRSEGLGKISLEGKMDKKRTKEEGQAKDQ